MATYGRTKIKISESEINAENIVEILKRVLPIHMKNAKECEHLYDVYRGKQAILSRSKDVREEINNKVLANHANEIVSFKVSYLLSEPIAYISRGISEATEKVSKLNEFMYMNNKAARDKEIADDFTICGTATRMVLPNTDEDDEDGPPFFIYTLDPRYSFVIYSSGLGEKPLAGVKFIEKAALDHENEKETVYSVYTPKMYYEVVGGKVKEAMAHSLGTVPMFEYVNNNWRIGAFEIVETLLDSINTLHSNRIDATEQFVQALMVFENCEISTEGFDEMRKKGAVKIKSTDGMRSAIKLLTADMKQADQQVQLDALYDEVLRITGMPSQAMGNNSDSSNNGAVIVRNGWYNAEARAKDTELLWRESEGNFLKLVLKICRDLGVLDLKPTEITEKFTRRNYEDIQVRSQVLATMLGNDKIAPRLAYTHCGMFVDAEEAYKESMEYYEKQREENAQQNAPNAANNQGANPNNQIKTEEE